MQRDDLLLFNQQSACQIIPFPSFLRLGHAKKVALLLAGAKTNKDADWRLNRAMAAHYRQMENAGLSVEDVEKQRRDYLFAIHCQCVVIESKWLPNLPSRKNGTSGGAA